MNINERVAFASKHFKVESVGIEIGVWKGDFSAQILSELKPKDLTLVDPWKYVPEYEFAWYGKGRVQSQSDMDEIYKFVTKRFELQISHGVVNVHRGIASELRNVCADWIYIDGDHTFDGVKLDIQASRDLLKKEGVLIFDDFGLSGWWNDGVTRAINEFVSLGLLRIIDVHKSQCACVFI